ncbi:hypothetical protein G7Y79_00060g092750 [Physcia stellaris]|nr:hypothetical protein G7Y79_00060g092750 [Physcia stellaris]
MLGILYPSLLISVKYPEGDVVYKEGIAVYRDVNRFLANLDSTTKQHSGVEPHLIARYCLQGSAGQWFFEQASYLQDYLTQELGILCEALYQKFDSKELQQQTKPANDIVRLSTPPRSETVEHHTSKAMPAMAAMPTPPSTPKQSPAASTETPKAVTAMPTPPSTPKQSPAAPTETPNAVAAMPTPPATPPPSEPALVLTPPITSSKTAPKTSLPDTPPATPRKQISWAEIASRPVVAPKPSRLPIPTPRIIPKALETAAANCPPTLPPTPPQTPISKHQEPKPYLTIDDLFKMFDGKHKRMDLLHSNHQAKKTESSPKVSNQTRITSYFKPAANQNASISQGSKTPKPRSFRQLMPAESIRTKSLPTESLPRTEIMPEKSAVSPYKMAPISAGIPFTPAPYHYKGHALNGGPNFCSQWIRTHEVNQSEAAHYQECGDSKTGTYICRALRWPPSSNTPLMALIKKTNPHTCRRCFRAFRSNNELHEHLRCTHLEHRRRRRSTEWTPPVETSRRLNQPWRKL